MAQNFKKFISVALYISGTIYHMIFIYGTHEESQLLKCNNITSFDKFTILAYGNDKYIVEIRAKLAY